MFDLTDKQIVVTGGRGFLGTHLVKKLREHGATKVIPLAHHDYDLRDRTQIQHMFDDLHPEVIIHLAAVVGGIGANRLHPGSFFYDNAIMGIQLIEEARLHAIEKLVQVGTICAYPKFTSVPFKEEDLWNGYPEETNAPYGLAKKMLLVQLQAYRQEYGFNGIYLLLVNLYGPRDNNDLVTSHVIPAMIRKFKEAKEQNLPTVTLWGDGSPTREFLHVKDAAEGIVLATERYDKPEPVNLGSGQEISIRDLADLIKKLTSYQGAIIWDTTQPNGQPRRLLDVSRAEREFGFKARTPLLAGLNCLVESSSEQG
jgi:GDP-L-fucose synthase